MKTYFFPVKERTLKRFHDCEREREREKGTKNVEWKSKLRQKEKCEWKNKKVFRKQIAEKSFFLLYNHDTEVFLFFGWLKQKKIQCCERIFFFVYVVNEKNVWVSEREKREKESSDK